MPLLAIAASSHWWTFPIIGLVAGTAIGLTGMGGGVILTPILVLVLGVPAKAAVANDLVVSLLVKPLGALTHRRAGTVRHDIVGRLALGSVPAAFAGAYLVNRLFDDSTAALSYLIGGVLLLAAAMMLIRLLTPRERPGTGGPVRPAPTILVGAIGGLLVGMTSVGSGSLMLVLLAWIYPRLSSRELVGTDLAQAVPLVASAALGHLLFGDVRLGIAAPLLLGALPGVWLGSQMSTRMPDGALRPTLLVLVGASGLRLVGVL
jgi:hypothetical protein